MRENFKLSGDSMNVKIKTTDLCAFSTITYPQLSILTGKTVFLNGPSGCGKSTLLKLLNGVLSPSAGQVILDNQDITTLNPITLRRRVILAEQSVYLFRGTIADNFRLFHQYRETIVPDAEKCRALMEVCCIPFKLEESCNALSGGERQRIFLAVALSMNPEVLLLDEPTSAMDNALAHTVMKNLIRYCHSCHITMLVVSHDLELSNTYADEIISLEVTR